MRTDPPFGARVSERRGAVLNALRAAAEPVPAERVAAAVGLHTNTVRFHLRHLVEDGLAAQTTEQRTGPGRPRVLYRARTEAPGGRSYLLLAQMLAQATTAAKDPAIVELTGRRWGGQLLTEGIAAGNGTRSSEAALHLHAVLDSIGFAPDISTAGAELTITLRHCPFLEVARRHPALVCGMHEGLIQGVLDGLDSGMQVGTLRPIFDPIRCTAIVAPSGKRVGRGRSSR
ncbi:MAG: helix-turn-helix transcriptional regulator [Sporichthyaceae bacterium]